MSAPRTPGVTAAHAATRELFEVSEADAMVKGWWRRQLPSPAACTSALAAPTDEQTQLALACGTTGSEGLC